MKFTSARVQLWELVIIGLICIVLAWIIAPMFLRAKSFSGPRISCPSNLKQIAVASLIYAADYNERLPLSDNWLDALSPYTRNRRIEYCPSVGSYGQDFSGYAFNSKLSGDPVKDVRSPRTTPLLFESSKLRRNAADSFQSFLIPGRHAGSSGIAFVDGHVKFFKTFPEWP